MTSNVLKCGALLIALIAPVETRAEDNNTSPPTVIVPQTTPAPQTPAYPPPPVGANAFGVVAPRASGSVRSAPHVVAPANPPMSR
jgi:hypothetical protein